MTFHVGDRVMCTAKKVYQIYYGDTGVGKFISEVQQW